MMLKNRVSRPSSYLNSYDVAVEFLSSLQFSGVLLDPITVLPLPTVSRLGPTLARSSPLFTCETCHFVNTRYSTEITPTIFARSSYCQVYL